MPRGVAVAVGAGFSPGFSCLLAVHAAELLERVTEVHVARVGTGGPACARQHHRALGGEAVDWRDGEWQRRSAGSGRELCWFPDPVGGRDCYRAALPDPLLLVGVFPGVDRVTARLAATRRDRLTSRLPMLRPPHADGGPGAVRVEVRGEQAGGGTATIVYGAMEVPSMATAAVAAVAAEVLASGQARRSGAAGLGELLDPLLDPADAGRARHQGRGLHRLTWGQLAAETRRSRHSEALADRRGVVGPAPGGAARPGLPRASGRTGRRCRCAASRGPRCGSGRSGTR